MAGIDLMIIPSKVIIRIFTILYNHRDTARQIFAYEVYIILIYNKPVRYSYINI